MISHIVPVIPVLLWTSKYQISIVMNICHCLGELQGLQSSDYFWRCHFTSFNRINRSQMFFKIGVLKNFEIFAGKHPCLRLVLIKLQPWRFFPVNIAKILRTPFLTVHLWWLLLIQSFSKKFYGVLEDLFC